MKHSPNKQQQENNYMYEEGKRKERKKVKELRSLKQSKRYQWSE